MFGDVQKMVDQEIGIDITPRKPQFPQERVDQIAHSLEDSTVEAQIIQRRAQSASENVINSYADDYAKENAKLRSNAGLKCYIVRSTDGNCCTWCTQLAGRYEYGEEPDDIYRRHDNCSCVVTYENGRKRQDVWSKKSWEAPETDKSEYKPEVLDYERAKAVEAENMQYKGVDKSGESGIIIKEQSKEPITEITDKAIESVPKIKIDGYTDEQCELIQQHHKELLKYSRDNNDSKEVAFLMDSSMSSRKEFVGSDDKLDFGSELYGKDLFVMHNHPRNSSYSITDLIFFRNSTNVKTLTIIKNSGGAEFITKTSEFDGNKYKLEYDRLYKKIVLTGTESEKDKFVRTFLRKTKSGVIWSERQRK